MPKVTYVAVSKNCIGSCTVFYVLGDEKSLMYAFYQHFTAPCDFIVILKVFWRHRLCFVNELYLFISHIVSAIYLMYGYAFFRENGLV